LHSAGERFRTRRELAAGRRVVFKVMTWNVENLFRPGADAGPTTEPVYEAKLQGLAATINAQAPDALSLQEVGDPAALEDGELVLNPCLGLRLPAARGRRERIANPDEAGKLLAALPPVGRAVWATAFYAGLRLGELRALRWENVDLAEGVIRVEAALDARGSIIAPKSRSGRRTVPIPNALRQVLLDLKRKRSHGYAFGDGKTPFSPSSTYLRARRAWRNAGLAEIGLHEAGTPMPAFSSPPASTPKRSRSILATLRSRSPSTYTIT
jgi:integrase